MAPLSSPPLNGLHHDCDVSPVVRERGVDTLSSQDSAAYPPQDALLRLQRGKHSTQSLPDVSHATEGALEQVSVDELIRVSGGFGRFQKELMTICCGCSGAGAMVTMQAIFLLPFCKQEFGLSSVQEGLISSAFFFGYMPGLYGFGWLGDHLGRRTHLKWSLLLLNVSGSFAYISPNYSFLVLMRCFAGAGAAGVAVGSFILLTEWVPAEMRATMKGALSCAWSIASIILALVAWFLGPIFKCSWRSLICTNLWGILTFFAVCARCPESVRFYVVSGRSEEAMDLVRRAAIKNGLPTTCLAGCCAAPVFKSVSVSCWDLLHPAVAKSSVLVSLTFFVSVFGYYGIALDSHLSEGTDLYTTALMGALLEVPVSFLVVPLADGIGRRYACSASLGMLSVALATAWTGQMGYGGDMRGTVIYSSTLCGRCAAASATTIVFLIAAEQFPSACRSVGIGFCSSMGRVGAIVAPLVLASSKSAVLWCSLVAGLSAGACLMLSETKGKELQDVIEMPPVPKEVHTKMTELEMVPLRNLLGFLDPLEPTARKMMGTSRDPALGMQPKQKR